ncbi:hypothetical protein J2X61_004674 [Bacillus sp. 3255]|nr:hypothetical protein [Bacillus sp. 3255]
MMKCGTTDGRRVTRQRVEASRLASAIPHRANGHRSPYSMNKGLFGDVTDTSAVICPILPDFDPEFGK